MSALFKLKVILLFFVPMLNSQTISDIFLDNKFFQTHKLREFIRSDEFKKFREKFGDKASVDLIYKKALVLSNYNIADALLISGLATLDHRKINFKIPLLGLKIPIFLTSENEKIFRKRVENLPAYLFSDTLNDKDKLQHFFFSAYLSYLNGGSKTADKIGLLIEEGEKLGLNLVKDERDILANRCGQIFGLALHKNPFVLPSRFLNHNFSK
ncbi:hypothetical protein JGI1_00858 [Candidatus Thermokryptus mobilis]|uniref:Uncharacterized protein n=1 Tax=Candidatus Thermokryptus mobilis TaxID=1643428 RepID=A0A0S4MYA4_9BACT|nr:hypothetical protein [Candidatus Thermokryptus mobilis]CUU03936.1 hypothetical protein JGI1_00858 [Candidatus Thermokryptus mobilis]